MKIQIVSNTYPPADISGVGSLAQELLEGLADSADIKVLTRTAPVGNARVLATGGLKVLFPLLAAWRAKLGRGAADVIHVNESDGVVIAVMIAIRRRLGLSTPQLAATFQVSYRREAAEVRTVMADGVPVSSPTRSERIFRTIRAPLLERAGKLTAQLADRVVACSHFTAEELEADYRVARHTITVIANGIRLGPEPIVKTEIRTEPQNEAQGEAPNGTHGTQAEAPLQALYVGRLRTRKAVCVLLQTLGLPAAKNVELSVVGDGEQEHALLAQARSQNLEQVTFLGRRTREQVAAHYQDADVFVLPSTYEGFPVAILEAMAAGLPIIATRVAGIPEAFIDGESGILVDPEDATGLANALNRLANDRDACRAMGAAARRHVTEHFSIERIGQQYLTLWQEMAL